ncbi:MAG: peptide-N-glycosidase F-related protein [Polyangiales bacterium]
MTPSRLVALAACLTLGCTSAPPTSAPAPDAAAADVARGDVDTTPDVPAMDVLAPAEPATVSLFERTHVYFTGSENRRAVDATVRFPAAVVGRYARATLTLTLACPSNRCDAWDRVAALSILEDAPDGGTAAELEFARFVTPDGVGGTWTLDVTPLLPLFQGERRVRAFIDTWVGPGHTQGNGWLVTASLALEPGVAEHATRAVIPLRWQRMVYGDPNRPIDMQLPPQTVSVPAGTRGARAWVVTTGHGQGNRDNCAEFCARAHVLRVDDAVHEHALWRDNCAENPIRNQRGNWQPNRAGWCPGDIAAPWIAELRRPRPGPHTVAYDVDDWVNTCRPGASPCTGCVFNTGCAYNDGSHTEPYYRVAAYVLLTD